MPQMAPISWLFMFLLFSTSLILFCLMNYFIMSPNIYTFSWLFMFLLFSTSLILFCLMNYFIMSPKATLLKKEISFNSMNWKW